MHRYLLVTPDEFPYIGFENALAMPMAAAVHIVVPWLHIEVTPVPNDLRRVVIKMSRVVKRRLTPTVTRSERPISSSQSQRSNRTIDLANLAVTVSPSVTVLRLCFAAKRERECHSECDDR